ncbi:MAG: apolipoprotein N-acyltransferase [Spirochaetaceae bacterium]|nr:apolipoprotein N-acyltransferase [Spirochaetaceae bacterium]
MQSGIQNRGRFSWLSRFSGAVRGGLLVNAGLLVCAVVLFAASHPNPLFPKGVAAAGWVAYIPVFLLIRRCSLPASLFWGAVYGYVAYNLFGYWLAVFHPLAGIIVGTLELFWFALLFFLLKLIGCLFRPLPRFACIPQTLLWVGFEYLRTLGFVGYPYGFIAYSQWQVIPLIQIAGLAGVWVVSAVVLFPQAVLGNALPVLSGNATAHRARGGGLLAAAFARKRFPKPLVPLIPYAVILAAALVYGFAAPHDFSAEPHTKVALIQHNTDPWKGGLAEYRENFRVLARLSDEALRESPDIDLVVWSETAFVPRIYWHQTYRDDPDSYALVKDLLDYLAAKPVPFLIGNDDARRELTPSGRWERVDYNAAVLFRGAEIVEQYRKLHLVPFTEYFPYEKQFPVIYQWLLAADTHFWKPGTEATVFEISGGGRPVKFSTPICFEDSFADLSRAFVRNGADLIVNISNDAWSGSLSAQYQHLSMAVFRTVENRRAMVRSTASGQTCVIMPDGAVLAESAPFAENYLTARAPRATGTTPYTALGDFFPVLCLAFALGALAFVSVIRIKRGGRI